MDDARVCPHALYARLGVVIFSAAMSAEKDVNGEWKKKFGFTKGWNEKKSRGYNKSATGFALVCNAESGCTGIDIDDPETETNQRLMRLMEACTLVARTKKGFHYVFKNDARIKQTASAEFKLDTRNDGGCLFVAPSVAYDDAGNTVAEYKWVKVPPLQAQGVDAALVAIPEAVIDFLRSLNAGHVRSVDAGHVATVATVATAPECANGAGPSPAAASANAARGVRRRRTDRREEGLRSAVATAHPTTAPTTAVQMSAITPAREAALKREALRAVKVRAGTERVGYPTEVVLLTDEDDQLPVWGSPVCRINFTHSGTRVCPVTRIEHGANHFFVALGVDQAHTGLPAFFIYCQEISVCNKMDPITGMGKRVMLTLIDPESYEELGIDPTDRPDIPTTLSFGQTVVLLGKMQESIDRLIENPGASSKWDNVLGLGEVACALCTAASGFPTALELAEEMLAKLIAASTMTHEEKEHAERGFQHAKMALEASDPLMKVRGLAEGLAGKREHELMAIRAAITACTESELGANVTRAAEHMLEVLDYCDHRDEATGRLQPLGDIDDLGAFIFYTWWRVVRYGNDESQSSEAHQWTMYFFNGATYARGQWRAVKRQMKRHVTCCLVKLHELPALRTRASSALARCRTSDFIARAIGEAVEYMHDETMLAEGGLMSPDQFDRELDQGDYIGLTNGVYDVDNLRFMEKGQVPVNVLVSKTTRYAYIGPDDPRFHAKRAEIQELYRTTHASDYNDPDDVNLATMRMLAGSFLTRGNSYKKVIVFLGAAGDNGKSTFTKLIQLTLGDYAVTGNKRSLSGTVDQDTLDPDLVANHKSLLCVFPEVQSNEAGLSCGFKFNGGKLKALTGDDEQGGRALYSDARCYEIGFVPLVHTNLMPLVDSNDTTATSRLWIAPFDSKFPEGLTVADPARRLYPRIDKLKERLREWAPYHFLIMVEGLREFRARRCILPPGAQTIAGSLAHQALADQTPDGKLRTWVEGHMEHVPVSEKDNGTKLEELHGEYVRAGVHPKPLGKTTFAAMLRGVYPGIGPHKSFSGGISGLYLLR
jgi:phage/plasmid-associated DNA primase